MPKSPRRKPIRLPEKLRCIRYRLNLTQEDLTRRIGQLGFVRDLDRAEISDFERGRRDPDVLTQLSYARLINVCLDVLVDDRLDLPDDSPKGPVRCAGIDHHIIAAPHGCGQ